ncbi:MAG: hypothetical protein KKI09_01480 [Spirochaetes bacterium]|nr:hypothetical protein [Spirochaetota bacterium]MBU0954074.1 hypothetical protein [Spirochaetota bacterium]
MNFAYDSLSGNVNFVSGPEKNCGKTSFMVAALTAWRKQHPGQSPALMTVGYDGETRDLLSGVRKPAVPVCAGDYFITTERFLRSSGCAAEIIDVVPGSTALGRCCMARAQRDGMAALVGPEGNSAVAAAIGLLRENCPDRTIMVDGAINRITQLASVPDARLIYVLRVDRSSLNRSLERLQRLSLLLRLSLVDSVAMGSDPRGGKAVSGAGSDPRGGEAVSVRGADPGCAEPVSGAEAAPEALYLPGALTLETLQTLPIRCRALLVDDFTKIFLGAAELRSFLRTRQLYVRNAIRCSGIVVITRGLTDSELDDRIDDAYLRGLISYNLHRQDQLQPDAGIR